MNFTVFIYFLLFIREAANKQKSSSTTGQAIEDGGEGG